MDISAHLAQASLLAERIESHADKQAQTVVITEAMIVGFEVFTKKGDRCGSCPK